MLAILTFSLVAGFAIDIHVQCDSVPDADAITATIQYPFSSYSYNNGTGTPQNMSRSLDYGSVVSSGQFFVTMGVFSMFYCMIALAVYVLFTANEQFEKVVDILVYVVSDVVYMYVAYMHVPCVSCETPCDVLIIHTACHVRH